MFKVKIKVKFLIFKVGSLMKINRTKLAKKEQKTKRLKESSSYKKIYWREKRNQEQ
jgi:hypothetical protein